MAIHEPVLPEDLEAGYRRFRTTRYPSERERYRRLATDGQRPSTVVVACSDSRAAPEIVFDAGPGELFVIRNVAALVPAYAPDARHHAASAALEYAILALDVGAIVVMGHGRCGGVEAALEQPDPLTPSDFVGAWVSSLRDLAGELRADEHANAADVRRALEWRSIEESIDNLRTFPWIRSRELAETISLHGAWFDIGPGELHVPAGDGWVRLPGI